MFEYKTTGKTINEAIEKGLTALKLERRDVEIKICKNAKNFQDAVVVLCVPDNISKNCEQIERLNSLQNLEKQIADAENILKKSKAEKNNILESLSLQIMQDNKTLTKEQIVNLVKRFVDGIILSFKVENFESVAVLNDEVAKIKIKGNHLQKFIGYKGKTLGSLQFLANVFASKFGRPDIKIYLDINGYKEQKEKQIENLANETIKQVQETQKEVSLPPMNAFERRIVHNIVAQFRDLTTISVGEEPQRYVIIKIM